MAERYGISAGTVVPMNTPPIKDGAVIVSDGRIEAVTHQSQLPPDIPCEAHPDAILLPAFVNAHTHLVLTAFRGLADDADFYTWITEHVIPLGLDRREDECRQSAISGVRECFRNGITALGESHYTTWGLDTMRDLGMKGVLFWEVFGLRTRNLAESLARDRKQIEELVSEATDCLRAGVSPHAPYSVTPPMAALVSEFSENLQLPISTHIAETRDEIELFLRSEGRFAPIRHAAGIPPPDGKRTPLKYFDELNLLTPRTLIIHGVHLSDSDLDVIADRGCTLVTCPTSNAKLGVGIARVGAWMDRGIPVCIATDSPASGETFDLFEEMRRFVLLQRGLTGETSTFAAEEVIRMVTTAPAIALGMDDVVGDLREGSCADLMLLEPDSKTAGQFRDVYQTLLWDITARDIVAVWADGREVYRR